MISECDEFAPENPFQVIDFESGHSPFASNPTGLAAVLGSLDSPIL
jgi:hypothetical protein